MAMERLLGGKYPISLGTALIFEQKDFDITKWPRLLYINLRTLYRNFVASIPVEKRHRIHYPTFVQDYLYEVAEVERIIKELSHNRIQLFFYYPRYKQFDKLLPQAEMKDYNPENFDEIELMLWKYVKQKGLMVPFNYEIVEQELPPAREPILLLSSFVIDLLSAARFPSITLLESYTGKLKKRPEWFTKLNLRSTKENPVEIPFNKFTIQIFGDKSGAIQGASRQLRSAVREMAMKDHWTPVTSTEKIKYSISKLKDVEIKKSLSKYL